MTTVAAYVALLLGAVLILAAPLLVAAAPPTSSRTGDVKIVKFNQIQDENSYKFECVIRSLRLRFALFNSCVALPP